MGAKVSNVEDRSVLTEQYKSGKNLSTRLSIHQRFSVNQQGWFPWAFQHISGLEGPRVLEVGSGTGGLWQTNLSSIPLKWRVTLSDFSKGMLEETKRTFGSAASQFDWILADAQSLPFLDESKEIIIANHMLYHVPDRARAIAEFARVLSPEGTLVASTNGMDHMKELTALAERVCAGGEQANVATHFGLENGEEQLKSHFSSITQHIYEDALMVTEAAPLVDYIRSFGGNEKMGEEEAEELFALISEEIKDKGAFRVTKSTGLFICRK